MSAREKVDDAKKDGRMKAWGSGGPAMSESYVAAGRTPAKPEFISGLLEKVHLI